MMKLHEDPECKWFREHLPNEFAAYGCGPGGVGDWFVPDTIYGLSIVAACRIHDFDYRHGGGASKKHRKQCDIRLRTNMFIIVKDNTYSWALKRLRFTRCRTYYRMVRIFGGPAYWEERQ